MQVFGIRLLLWITFIAWWPDCESKNNGTFLSIRSNDAKHLSERQRQQFRTKEINWKCNVRVEYSNFSILSVNIIHSIFTHPALYGKKNPRIHKGIEIECVHWKNLFIFSRLIEFLFAMKLHAASATAAGSSGKQKTCSHIPTNIHALLNLADLWSIFSFVFLFASESTITFSVENKS